jgi:hypothetical protein
MCYLDTTGVDDTHSRPNRCRFRAPREPAAEETRRHAVTDASPTEDEIRRRIELGLAEDAEDALAAIEDDELDEFDDWDGEGEGK